MADINNLTEINENFDTVKTLLNSIRAQGILNTSDVDKLLSGINAKLDKINTDEDIDMIKVYLTELKQNLDERHNILVSKFGAIEALFSNLLKNSNELPKSSELKELFDVVATNLSVFSREVVSQKETLTDITLRLDAIRSDDSQKKDIIKNITLLKPDLERLNNGFDSIVLSLNDNFKTIVKTITSIDKTEYLDRFSSSLSDIEMSNKAIVSAIQILDKKSENIDEALENLVSKSDFDKADKNLGELKLISQSINDNINDISDRYARIDALADKVDASVNIIASLKSVFEDSDNENTSKVLSALDVMELELKKITSDTKFEEFKESLTGVLKDITDNTMLLDKNIKASSNDIETILSGLKALDMDTGMNSVLSAIKDSESALKGCIAENSNKANTLYEANISRVLDNISSNADSLNAKLNQTNSEITMFCETNFDSVLTNISELRNVVSQLDENGVSANNAMFSNISDRLDMFENTLKSSLEFQENSSSEASTKLYEQVDLIKNISNVLDYKMDSSVVEISEMKRNFDTLKSSIDSVLALDFTNAVKDLRADLYASKQDLTAAFDNSNTNLSEKLSNDVYAKYELLISKLDSLEDGLKGLQASSMNSIKDTLDKISESLVDVISYVSESKEFPYEEFDRKLESISGSLKETNLNYVENVRDVVDVIRAQVDSNLKCIEEDVSQKLDLINSSISKGADSIMSSVKNSYDKLVEVQGLYGNLQSMLDNAGLDRQERFDKIMIKTASLSEEVDSKITEFKNSLINKINEYKQEFTVDNAGKLNEFKISVENLNNKNSKEISDIVNAIKKDINDLSIENSTARGLALDSIIDNFNSLKELFAEYTNKNANERARGLELISDDFNALKEILADNTNKNSSERDKALTRILDDFNALKDIITDYTNKNTGERARGLELISEDFEGLKQAISDFKSENNDLRDTALDKIREKFSLLDSKLDSEFNEIKSSRSDISGKICSGLDDIKSELLKESDESSKARTSALAKILENFTGIKEFLTITNDKSVENISSKILELKDAFEEAKSLLNTVDENIDKDMTRQLSIIESNFESLISQINILSEKTENDLSDKIKTEFSDISERLTEQVSDQLEGYKSTIEDTFNNVIEQSKSNSEFVRQKVLQMNDDMRSVWKEQSDSNYKQIEEFTNSLRSVLDEKIKLSESDYNALRDEIDDFTRKLELNNETLTESFKERLDEITKYVGSVIDIQTDENNVKYEELKNLVSEIRNSLNSSSTEILNLGKELSDQQLNTIEGAAERLYEQVEIASQNIKSGKEFISEFMKKELSLISANVEKETDIVIAEIIEQFDQLKKHNADEVLNLTSSIESAISEHVYNNIEDLKSYFDVKTDSALLSDKLDNLKIDITTSFGNVMSGMNRMLEADVFTGAMSDFRLANELLVNSAADKINEKVEAFVKDSVTDIAGAVANSDKDITEKLALFDKKFTDTIVDKYEEIKLVSNNYNSAFEEIKQSFCSMSSEFSGIKSDISNRVNEITSSIEKFYENSSSDINELKKCFEGLREQISNKTFEEAFQTSLNKQLTSLETLINEQLGYLDDINELCSVNLPDVTELNTLVKGAVLETLNNLSDKIDSQNIGEIVENEINSVKSDIITQIINIFNQISFVTEQEEILDFIQDKHEELISVLSHIVTNTTEIGLIKDGVTDIESAVSAVRDDIDSINEKIDNIISSSGDADYIYSLQDLEDDIANLRLAIKDMKDNSTSSKNELNALIEAAEKVDSALTEFKDVIPSKNDLGNIAEDIVSISTRTNKLILASDESYKALQDNLQEFKLVINDLDERTRNFAHESGMDRIDSKLNTLNNLVQSGAKSNQVFNEVFEYLAEWVDKAGVQIDNITNKVETLDDIGQIKVMLQDLKEEAADNSDSVELIEALGNVFDKQAKKISSLETKLDKMIVETTIAGKNNKVDLKPMEETLNRFLVAMDEKLSTQQNKINSLEKKLAEMADILDEKDTNALTKKVGGMDRQIAKLNKSIEKIASHVVEK